MTRSDSGLNSSQQPTSRPIRSHLSQEGRSGQQLTAQCHSAASLSASTQKKRTTKKKTDLPLYMCLYFLIFTVDFSRV